MGCIVFSVCPKQGVHPFISGHGPVCTCQFFLRQVWGISVWLPGFQNNLKISDNFPNTSGGCSKFFQRYSNFLSTFPLLQYGAHVLSLQIKCNLKAIALACFDTLETHSQRYMPFWNILKMWNWIFLLIMNKNKIVWMCESDIHVKSKYCPWWVRMMSVVPRHVTQA